jgi:hypothetical protein
LAEPTVGQLGKVPDEGEELLAAQVEANKVPALLQLLHSLETKRPGRGVTGNEIEKRKVQLVG